VAGGTGGFSSTLSGGTFSAAQSGNDLNFVFTAGVVATPVSEATGAAAALSALLGTASSADTVVVAAGDAKLDGQVTLTDITLVNNGLTYGAGASSGAVWGQGDFTYSNGVTLNDVTLLNNAGLFGQGSYLPATPTSASPATAPSGITSAGSGGPVISQDAWIALALSLKTNSTRRW